MILEQSQPKSQIPGFSNKTVTAHPQTLLQPETILLSVIGMSPAILTETVWALAQSSEPVFPDRIIPITTRAGADRLQQQLLSASPHFNGQSPWTTLRNELLSALTPDSTRTHCLILDPPRIITRPDLLQGQAIPLDDIRSAADNEATADFLLEQVRAITDNPNTRLIASLAGGRKTMGALLYACLTLVGRETDRLTHVLVNEPFEFLDNFFFPHQPGGPLTDRRQILQDPMQAVVELADVPFVPVRNLFAGGLRRPLTSFQHLVDASKSQVRTHAGAHVRLELDGHRKLTRVNDTSVDLSPREFLVLLFLAHSTRSGETGFVSYEQAASRFNTYRADIVAQAPPEDWSNWQHQPSLESTTTERDLIRLISSMRIKFRNIGGDAALLAACLPERGRLRLDIPGSLIFIHG